MPIYNTRDIIPFVNELESKINKLNHHIQDWVENKHRIEQAVLKIGPTETRSLLALQRAEEALTEITTATYGIVANRGQRLAALIEELKENVSKIILEGGSGSGSGNGIGNERINKEVNNAISKVNSIIEDGLKLDYRLREIEELAKSGGDLNYKDMIVPYTYEIKNAQNKEYQIKQNENIVFVEGLVTVLDENKEPIVVSGELLEGTIDENGIVNLNFVPGKNVTLYFPVKMNFKDIPQDVLYTLLNTVLQKSSSYIRDLVEFKKEQEEILADISAMKGANWTAEYSIMRNHHDIIKESITPKGLNINIINDEAHLTFSYNDHEKLSHFEIEIWDEEKKKFVPFKTVYKA